MTSRTAFLQHHCNLDQRCFVVPGLPGSLCSRRVAEVPVFQRQDEHNAVMKLSIGRTALYAGGALLVAALTNRLVLTPLDSLAMTQSRSDILGVISGATLLLYGVGKLEITDNKAAVQLEGIDVRQGFEPGTSLAYEIEWAADSILEAIPNVGSFALFVDGVGTFFKGKFREEEVTASVVSGGIVSNATDTGKRAYLADMKVVPVKELEFGFLPSNCQAVIVQPVSSTVALVLGANKARPFTAADFGWVQAISDRLAEVFTA